MKIIPLSLKYFSYFSRLIAVKGEAEALALAPVFGRRISEKCFKPAERPKETLATQAMKRSSAVRDLRASVLKLSVQFLGT